MPLTHTRTFRVRHYECDAFGHVNAVNYVRYMQEAAFDASAAAGYDMARYEAIGRLWLVRETDIEYLYPLRYGDSVEVKTWVADFRRVRSRRDYEMRKAGSGELVARAYSDWAFLDRVSRRPAAIPDELIAAFFPDGALPDSLPRKHFPAAPPPPPGLFSTRRRVEWRDVDPAAHVNNAVYLSYVEDCAIQVGAAYGWTGARMMQAGFGIIARRHHVEYREQAVLGDELEIATWVSDVHHASATRHYTITRPADGAKIAQVNSRYVWADLQTGKPIRIPEGFLEDFAPNIVASGQ